MPLAREPWYPYLANESGTFCWKLRGRLDFILQCSDGSGDYEAIKNADVGGDCGEAIYRGTFEDCQLAFVNPDHVVLRRSQP